MKRALVNFRLTYSVPFIRSKRPCVWHMGITSHDGTEDKRIEPNAYVLDLQLAIRITRRNSLVHGKYN